MIPFFGADISDNKAAVTALSGAAGFISYAALNRFELVKELCSQFAVDNGAYSLHNSGKQTDWDGFYKFLADEVIGVPNFSFFVIPDVIGGSEEENLKMVRDCPMPKDISAPVWHMNESYDFLQYLCSNFPRVCIGGVEQYEPITGPVWWERLGGALDAVTKNGRPICKLHGLRMLSNRITKYVPFSSADSTTLARNINLDVHWKNIKNKEVRAFISRRRVEGYPTAKVWAGIPHEKNLMMQGLLW